MARMSEFTFLSSDGQTALSAREYLPEGDSAGIVQIVHGIAEHIARYDAFASFLAGHGFIVVMHDQLGHGKSAPDEAHLGFFSEENGWEKAVQDIRSLHDKTATKYPGKPYFIFGHSMGSFLTRTYLIRFRTGLDGAVRRQVWSTSWQDIGVVTLETQVTIPSAWRRERVYFHVEKGIDDTAAVYVNGVKVGEVTQETPQYWMTTHRHRVPSDIIRFDQPNDIRIVTENLRGSGSFGSCPEMVVDTPPKTEPTRRYMAA